jgi:hypothetical protein
MTSSHKKTSFLFAILILIAIFLLGSVMSPTDVANLKDKTFGKKMSLLVPVKEEVVVKEKNKYDGRLFSFTHDPRLLVSEKNGIVIATHTVPYNKIDMCDLQDGSDLVNLDDFYMTLILSEGSLSSVIDKYQDLYFLKEYLKGDTLTLSGGFIEKANISGYSGYKATLGAEGCGQEVYILPVGENILILNRSVRPELTDMNPNFETAKLIPGVILKEEAQIIFEQIISTLLVK